MLTFQSFKKPRHDKMRQKFSEIVVVPGDQRWAGEFFRSA
jgi:hypothetical protein